LTRSGSAGRRIRRCSPIPRGCRGVYVAVFKSEAELVTQSGEALGGGMAYLHLPRGLQRQQASSGTISLKYWRQSDQPPVALRLPDGRNLGIRVSRDALSECSRNRVLRFEADWPPRAGTTPSGAGSSI